MSDVVQSGEPIRAWRAFGLSDDNHLESTIAGFVYEGPVAVNGVPPYTADEWERIEERLLGKTEFHTLYGSGQAAALDACRDDLVDALEWLGEQRLVRLARHPSLHEGFHAFRSREDVKSHYVPKVPRSTLTLALVNGRIRHKKTSGYPVAGQVDLFGRVVEYERGYRAEKLRIQRLIIREGHGLSRERLEAAVPTLESRYHCEVEVEKWPTSEEKSASTKSTLTKSTRPSLSVRIRNAWKALIGKK